MDRPIVKPEHLRAGQAEGRIRGRLDGNLICSKREATMKLPKRSVRRREAVQVLVPLIEKLTGPDDQQRYQALAEARCIPDRETLDLLVLLLVDVLAGRDHERRRQAALSLTALGQAALPFLILEAVRRRGVYLRLQLADLIGVIGRRIEHALWSQYQLDVRIIRDSSENEEVRWFCNQVLRAAQGTSHADGPAAP
jgi:hypothetical protein